MNADDFYTGELVVAAYARLRTTHVDPAPCAAFVRASGEAGLELGCGDGDPLLDLRTAGLDVDGVDSSADLLARCQRRASAAGLEVRLHHQRMQQLDLPRRYAAIYLAGPTFTLLPDDSAALAALRSIHRHLTPGGRASIPLWTPSPTSPDAFDQAREATDDDGGILRCTPVDEQYDPAGRTRSTRLRYERVRDGAVVERVERDWVIHWHTPSGFRDLAATAAVDLRTVPHPTDPTQMTTLLTR